jgi:hypothetical protein
MNRMAAIGTIQAQGTVYTARLVCLDDTVIRAQAPTEGELRKGLRLLARACDLRLRLQPAQDIGASLYKHGRAS